jgi:hypothetical protein
MPQIGPHSPAARFMKVPRAPKAPYLLILQVENFAQVRIAKIE